MPKLRNPVIRTAVGIALSFVCVAACAGTLAAQKERKAPGTKSGFITTPDGIKIHYLEAGHSKTAVAARVGNPTLPNAVQTKDDVSMTAPGTFPSILFVPGWTMPAWIWEKQIEFFSRDYRVVAMDPRSQGESTQTGEGLYPAARARDIKAVVDQLHMAPVVLVGWSMGVTEIAAYLDQFGTNGIAGIALVDGYAGGHTPEGSDGELDLLKSVLQDRTNMTSRFIRNVFFQKPQPDEYVNRLIQASATTPTDAAVALLVGMYEADYRAALPKINRPTLVCAAGKSIFAGQIADMQKRIPGVQYEVFEGAGHALFVDDADRFNSVLQDFIVDLVWP